ncbi:MAG: BMC domain-containing protein [Acidimicrobiia bacterium]
MSDTHRSPAVAVWEFDSIAHGILAADHIAKDAPIGALLTGTTHPGRYVVLAAGDTASVEVAREIVSDTDVTPFDSRFMPDIAPEVADAVTAGAFPSVEEAGEALGVVETSSVSSGIDAADAAVKAASVTLAGIRLADGIGGKAYLVVEGVVGEVEAAVESAVERAQPMLVASVVIPQLASDLRADLAASARLRDRVRQHGRGAG